MEQNGISKICIEQSPCCTVLAPYRHWTLFFFEENESRRSRKENATWCLIYMTLAVLLAIILSMIIFKQNEMNMIIQKQYFMFGKTLPCTLKTELKFSV